MAIHHASDLSSSVMLQRRIESEICVLNYMFFESLLLTEGPRANLAPEGPFTRVCSHVGRHIVLKGKRHRAEMAFEWLFARVDHLVPFQVPTA